MNLSLISPVIQQIGSILTDKQESISVAESVTGGYIQFLLSTCPDAQHFFQGGITTYNGGQKTLQLCVNPLKSIQNNAVSIEIASKMAASVADRFYTEWSIGVTGFASSQENQLPFLPYCYYSFWYKQKELLTIELTADSLDSIAVQQYFGSQILIKLLETTALVYREK